MKVLSSLPFLVSLCLLVSCNGAPDSDPALETSFDPQTCIQKSVRACGVDWKLIFNRDNFPKNAQIMINNDIIIDDCDPLAYWSRENNTTTVDYKIMNYSDIAESKTFSVTLFDRIDCSSPKKQRFFLADRKVVAKTYDGIKELWVSFVGTN